MIEWEYYVLATEPNATTVIIGPVDKERAELVAETNGWRVAQSPRLHQSRKRITGEVCPQCKRPIPGVWKVGE